MYIAAYIGLHNAVTLTKPLTRTQATALSVLPLKHRTKSKYKLNNQIMTCNQENLVENEVQFYKFVHLLHIYKLQTQTILLRSYLFFKLFPTLSNFSAKADEHLPFIPKSR